MDIRIIIAGLLEEHECVIIPGFGGFIGSYCPARVDPVNHRFIPPGKKILFNVRLRDNDGLLVNRVARESAVSYDVARRSVEDFVTILQQHVKTTRGFTLPRIGRLFSDREGNIQFEQDRNTNLLAESFGLFSFVAPPITRNSYTDRIEKKMQSFGLPEPEERPGLRRFMKWAAVLAVPVTALTILGITQYHSFSIQPLNKAGFFSSVFSKFSYASLFDKKDAPATHPEYFLPDEQEAKEIYDSDLYPAFPDGKEELTSETVPEELPAQVQDHAYVVIIGAFRIDDNARKAVQQARENGFDDAVVYDRSASGLYRVAMGVYSDMEDARQAIAEAQAGEYPGAWLLEK